MILKDDDSMEKAWLTSHSLVCDILRIKSCSRRGWIHGEKEKYRVSYYQK